ncbi:mRNA splicing factor SYF2, partial [Tuber magnatum]
KKSAEVNRKEVYAERRRQVVDPSETSRLNRKRDEAEFKLAKAEAEDDGEDFERKRAWDWTIEESERWDKRMEKRKKHVEDVAFQDYTQTARKIYKKQLRELQPDLESYAAEKAKLIRDGTIVETEDGELIAVDRDGEFYADANSLGFIDNKPSKGAIDRLVGDLKKAEDARMRRRKGGDEEDVTYINDKNKQFNQKLARYYNKYTGEIRDSFERGTMV